MNITDLTVHELQDKLAKKEITVLDITKAYLQNIEEKYLEKNRRKCYRLSYYNIKR